MRTFWRRSRRRGAAALTLLAVAVAAIGVPLPAATPKQSGERFPCESCACGCSDAATCWRQCCCHTQTEKLAWAKRHGVRPPAFVVAAAAVEARSAKPASSCARCCSKCRPPEKPQPPRGRFVLLVSALRCQGVSVGVSALPPCLPPASMTMEFIVAGSPTAPIDAPAFYQSPAFDVATPPPDAWA